MPDNIPDTYCGNNLAHTIHVKLLRGTHLLKLGLVYGDHRDGYYII